MKTHSINSHRVLVFAQMRSVLELIESVLLRYYFPLVQYRVLHGGFDSAKKKDLELWKNLITIKILKYYY